MKEDQRSLPAAETLKIRDFPAKNCVPRPGWLVRGKERHLHVSGGRLEITYAETRI
jgi:hypothetical protein